jgi:hypothetical protein
MLTRYKEIKQAKRDARKNNKIILKVPLQRFLNPSKTYKIFDVSLNKI